MGSKPLSALIQALDHKAPNIRGNAALLIARIGTEAKAAAPALVRRFLRVDFATDDYFNGSWFRDALAKIQPDAFSEITPVMMQRLLHGTNRARWDAVSILGLLGRHAKSSAHALVHALLHDSVARVRRGAALALSACCLRQDRDDKASPRTPKEIVDALLKALEDSDSPVRANATRALANVRGHRDRVAGPVLAGLDKEQSLGVRWAAAQALAKFGKQAGTVPALVGALSDSSFKVRRAAVHSLGHIGPDATEAIPTLQALRDDPQLGSFVRDTLLRVVR